MDVVDGPAGRGASGPFAISLGGLGAASPFQAAESVEPAAERALLGVGPPPDRLGRPRVAVTLGAESEMCVGDFVVTATVGLFLCHQRSPDVMSRV